ncbi:MAG: EAL domain-containing protein, partial [Mycobacteriales bacterium]
GSRRLNALESLVRWRHPERGLIPPGAFLPVAEETGLIVRLGRLIVEGVCTQLASWGAEGLALGDLRVSVNVSNREFWHADFQAHLGAALDAVGGSPEWLNLEITEGVIMHNPEVALKMLTDLRRKGFHLHVDDFGTGYSSLDALHRFPIEALKIDQSFVARLETDRKSSELVRTIIMMGHNLDMQVIAEGVENQSQERILQDLGCRYGQGYLFARPLPAPAAKEFLRSSHIVGAADRPTTLP